MLAANGWAMPLYYQAQDPKEQATSDKVNPRRNAKEGQREADSGEYQ